MNTFLPQGYEVPKSPSNYMKFEEGINSIRILSSAIVGYEYFTIENKPVRSREAFEEMPSDIKKDGKIKPFWAFVVWNYQMKMIQILEVTQKTVMSGIKSLVDNPKWGDPKMYDIAITRTGEGLDSEYQVQGEPPLGEPNKDVLNMYNGREINLEALYDGGDPFTSQSNQTPPSEASTPFDGISGAELGKDIPL